MTPQKNNNEVYPGMACSGMEFFVNGKSLNIIHNQKILPFAELPFKAIQLIKESINESREVELALHDMHPHSEWKRLEQFARCRFGGLDFNPDIKNNKLQEGEYWPCPLHGKCPSEGILCKLPKINGIRLSKEDVKLMQLVSTDLTNEVIAEMMNYKYGSFHLAKKKLYQKLKVSTKQEVALIGKTLNLI